MKNLKQELPLDLANSADTDEQFCPLKWWKQYSQHLPSLAAATQKVLLVQPSSAVSERNFSFLKASVGDQQEKSLQDYIETSLMLQYNK